VFVLPGFGGARAALLPRTQASNLSLSCLQVGGGQAANPTALTRAGGTVANSGTFGAVNLTDGGTFAPGNSPGTATANDFRFGAGGRYDFELNTANSRWGVDPDLLTVTNALSVGPGTTPNSVFSEAIHSLNPANQAAALSDVDSRRWPATWMSLGAGLLLIGARLQRRCAVAVL